MEHSCFITVRFNECDMYGHVNHAVFLDYLEHGRIELLKAGGTSLIELKTMGYHLVVIEINVKYKKPAKLDDLLEIRTDFAKPFKVGGITYQKIYRNEEEILEAEVKWVCANSSGAPVRIPELISDLALDQFQIKAC